MRNGKKNEWPLPVLVIAADAPHTRLLMIAV
jgi:hypothetical protein